MQVTQSLLAKVSGLWQIMQPPDLLRGPLQVDVIRSGTGGRGGVSSGRGGRFGGGSPRNTGDGTMPPGHFVTGLGSFTFWMVPCTLCTCGATPLPAFLALFFICLTESFRAAVLLNPRPIRSVIAARSAAVFALGGYETSAELLTTLAGPSGYEIWSFNGSLRRREPDRLGSVDEGGGRVFGAVLRVEEDFGLLLPPPKRERRTPPSPHSCDLLRGLLDEP